MMLKTLWAVWEFSFPDNLRQIMKVGKISILPKILHTAKILTLKGFRQFWKFHTASLISGRLRFRKFI